MFSEIHYPPTELGAGDAELMLLQDRDNLLNTESLPFHGFRPSLRQVSLPETSLQLWPRFRGAAQQHSNGLVRAMLQMPPRKSHSGARSQPLHRDEDAACDKL